MKVNNDHGTELSRLEKGVICTILAGTSVLVSIMFYNNLEKKYESKPVPETRPASNIVYQK